MSDIVSEARISNVWSTENVNTAYGEAIPVFEVVVGLLCIDNMLGHIRHILIHLVGDTGTSHVHLAQPCRRDPARFALAIANDDAVMTECVREGVGHLADLQPFSSDHAKERVFPACLFTTELRTASKASISLIVTVWPSQRQLTFSASERERSLTIAGHWCVQPGAL